MNGICAESLVTVGELELWGRSMGNGVLAEIGEHSRQSRDGGVVFNRSVNSLPGETRDKVCVKGRALDEGSVNRSPLHSLCFPPRKPEVEAVAGRTGETAWLSKRGVEYCLARWGLTCLPGRHRAIVLVPAFLSVCTALARYMPQSYSR